MTDVFDTLILEINKTTLTKEQKQTLINKTYEAKKYRTLHNPNFNLIDTTGYKPDFIIPGDIITSIPNGLIHPAVIIKVDNDKQLCYAIPFTNNDNYLGNITEVQNNRFIKGNLTCTLQILTTEEALKFWKGNLGSTKELNRLIKEYKTFYSSLLNLKITTYKKKRK